MTEHYTIPLPPVTKKNSSQIIFTGPDFENIAACAIATATAEHKLSTEPIPILTPVKLAHLVALLAAGKENIWYNSGDWQAVRDAVKRIDHECIICKAAVSGSAADEIKEDGLSKSLREMAEEWESDG